METKYSYTVDTETQIADCKRLINQLWKLIPMREHEEDWKKQLGKIINELVGLNRLFDGQLNFLILISTLEGLYEEKEFSRYRSAIFESISRLKELWII